ncbi:MAG: hypothetical protein ACI8RD_002536, partial [Bacillariaceae sp.]|jgi:hypothetical protein
VGDGNGDISNIGEWPEISDENIEDCNGLFMEFQMLFLLHQKLNSQRKIHNFEEDERGHTYILFFAYISKPDLSCVQLSKKEGANNNTIVHTNTRTVN